VRQELPQEGAHGRGPAGFGPGGLAILKPLYSPFQPPPEVAVEGGAVQAQVAGDAGGGPALGGQADGLGPAPDLEGDHGVGLQLPEPGVLLWGQVDAKGGRHVDSLMHRHLTTRPLSA
jgi:hypothetical protein